MKYFIKTFGCQMSKITKRFNREFSIFKQLSRNSKLLLLCTTLFYFAGPFIGLFLNIYLWREASSLELVALFNLFFFLGLPIGFILNGYLLKKTSNKIAFQLGLLLQGIFPLIIIVLGERAFRLLVPLGMINGLSAAFYWANMNLLIYDLTSDKIRGYFTGINSTLSSIIGIIASPLAGFVIGVLGQNWLRMSTRNSYYLSFLLAATIFFLVTVIAGRIVSQKEKPDFSFEGIFSKKSRRWPSVRLLNVAAGISGGVFAFSFGLLAFKFFGKELDVGWFNGLMGIVGALAAYFAGRYAKPERRVRVYVIGVTFFFIGSIFFGINFSILGLFVFTILAGIGNNFLWITHAPIEMKEMDKGYLGESQRYNCWVDIEIFLNIGRILGVISFIFLTKFFNFDLVYRLIVIILAFVNLVGLGAVKNLAKPD